MILPKKNVEHAFTNDLIRGFRMLYYCKGFIFLFFFVNHKNVREIIIFVRTEHCKTFV